MAVRASSVLALALLTPPVRAADALVDNCEVVLDNACKPWKSAAACETCAQAHVKDLKATGCTTAEVESLCSGTGPAPGPPAPGPPPTQLNGHPLKLDADGMIETWLPNATAHHDFITRAMDHIAQLPPDNTTGMPVWLTHGQIPIYNNAHNPAGLFSGWAQVASALFAYSGDASWFPKVSVMLEYLLANGTTPADPSWVYPSVPYASSDPGALQYRGAASWDNTPQVGRGDGLGVIEPDKIGMVGSAYLLMWKHDATKAHFLSAAVNCATTLAATMNYDANGTHSPWPFRVFAETGAVRQAYSSEVLSSVELFDQLLALNSSAVTPAVAAQLRRARDGAWSWLVSFPLKNNNWCGYCEDITLKAYAWATYGDDPTEQCNYDSIQPLVLARYMMEQRTPGWQTHVPVLIDFVERKLIFWDQPGPHGPKSAAVQFGARCVSEQRADASRMSCHTSRYASTLLQYAEAIKSTNATAAAEAEENSRRSWAWATYCMDDDGLVDVTPGVGAAGKRTWFTVTLGTVGDTLKMIGVAPAAAGEGTRIVRAASPVTAVRRGERELAYTTFDADAEERVRLAPSLGAVDGVRVEADGEPVGRLPSVAALERAGGSGWAVADRAARVIAVRHRGRRVRVGGAPGAGR